MSERRPDQGGPLFPRRSLSGPATQTDPTAAPEQAGRERRAPRGRRRTRDADSAGQSTAAMGRVDQDEQARRGDSPEARHAPAPTPAAPPADPATGRRSGGSTTRQGSTPAATSGITSGTSTGISTGLGAAPAAEGARPRGKRPRKARLRIVRVDPWSVMKMALALSIALAVVTIVAVAIVWSVLDAAGVWESINTGYTALAGEEAGDDFDVQNFVGLTRVLGLTMVVSMANVVLLTALATLAAFMYNLAAALLGGFEVTLAEDR